jgi:hypothetical protein
MRTPEIDPGSLEGPLRSESVRRVRDKIRDGVRALVADLLAESRLSET